jgi:hypothetical protein
VEKCLEFLHSKGLENLQGLFRLCGSKTDIDSLRDQANIDVFIFEIPPDQEPHSVAGLFKQFLRELPEPLIPFDLYTHFITVATLNRTDYYPELIVKLISLLPNTNRYLLGKLCKFLYEVQYHKATTLMSCENLATCIGPNLIRTADNDLRTMIMDTPAIMSLFSIFIRDALVLFHDCDNLRPQNIRKKGKSLIEINKQMFTVHFSENEKKSILLNPGEILCYVLEKICNSRNMALETLTVLDGNRNPLPSLQMTLSTVEGRCVYLLTPPPLPPPLTEIKTKGSDITLPRIKFPETPKDEFIFPLPSPLTELSHKSGVDIPDVKLQTRKSIGKSISSSLINRGLSPRDNSQPDLPVSAGHTPRFLDECPLPPLEPTTEVKSVTSKEEKRKSWKNQLGKRTSEIHGSTKSLNNSNNVRNQIPPIHTNPSSKTLPTQNSKPKSELQVPPALTSTNNQVCVDPKENKRNKARSVKKGKENLISGNNS